MKETVLRLAKQVDGKRYGKYRGFVVDNKDPEQRGRLTLSIPTVLGDDVSDWALPCVPFGGMDQQGFFWIPEVDAQLWVEFEEGDVHRPIWIGTFWQKQADVPKDACKSEPTTRLLQTPAGHILQFDDDDGAEKFRLYHPADASMTIDENGTITLTDAQGSSLTLDADSQEIKLEDCNGNTITTSQTGTTIEDLNGNSVEMTASGITVKGTQITVQGAQVFLGGTSIEPVLKGASFMEFFGMHTHVSSPTGGPTSPPVPMTDPAVLSTSVFTI